MLPVDNAAVEDTDAVSDEEKGVNFSALVRARLYGEALAASSRIRGMERLDGRTLVVKGTALSAKYGDLPFSKVESAVLFKKSTFLSEEMLDDASAPFEKLVRSTRLFPSELESVRFRLKLSEKKVGKIEIYPERRKTVFHATIREAVLTCPLEDSINVTAHHFSPRQGSRELLSTHVCVSDGNRCRPVTLPMHISVNLSTFLMGYLQKYLPKERDCGYFVAAVTGRLCDYKGFFDYRRWKTTEVTSIPGLHAGDIVCLAKEHHCVHYAMYISGKMFLSVYGIGGPLVASDYKGMRRVYASEKVYRLTPPE